MESSPQICASGRMCAANMFNSLGNWIAACIKKGVGRRRMTVRPKRSIEAILADLAGWCSTELEAVWELRQTLQAMRERERGLEEHVEMLLRERDELRDQLEFAIRHANR